jgi:integrase
MVDQGQLVASERMRPPQTQLVRGRRVPARVVMEILGHASSRITLDVYSHVTADLSNEAAAAMERALWGDA